MEWKIEIRNRKGVFDPLGNGIKKNIKDLDISGVKKVNVSQVFIISGDITEADAKRREIGRASCRERVSSPV